MTDDRRRQRAIRQPRYRSHLTAVLMYRRCADRRSVPITRQLIGWSFWKAEGHAVPIRYAACADLGETFYPRRRPTGTTSTTS
jgi:hypothetical protein